MYQEDFLSAEMQFAAANSQLPENLTVSRYLALALCEQGDAAKLERAFKLADTAHDENPGDPSTAAALGWVLFKQKNYDAAAKVLRQSKQLNGGKFTPNAAYYYAEVLSAQGQKPEAKKILEELLRRDNSFSKRGRARRLNESL
jgi:tetratricopeptide (TPR) repeat protein